MNADMSPTWWLTYEDDPASHEDYESVPRWVSIGEVLHVHPAFDADNCPACGTDTPIGSQS